MISRDELLAIVRRNTGDAEKDHAEAVLALLEYINDAEITAAFKAGANW